ncbi:MAG TPA: hypothetical protein VF261_00650 [Candidatus Saccharimonadales bacterium]
MVAAIDDFRDSVLSLRPGNFMALGGAASGIVGTADSGSTVVAQLQRAVIEFARLYKSGSVGEELDRVRRDVTSKIMVAVTVDAVSEQRADELLDALAQLLKERA